MVTPHSRIHEFEHSRISPSALFPPLIAPGKREEGAEAEHEPLPTVGGFPEHRRERKVVDKNSTTELMLTFLLGLEGACE
jgi:hypothetical protein